MGDGGRTDWVPGDTTGLSIPAHIDAFMNGGADFMTHAFRTFGSISPSNCVTALRQCAPCVGGSTGQKFFIDLEYAENEAGLHRRLFLKFSRDFDDERRDKQRTEMASEVKFVPLSRQSGFPIRVPLGYFADYHAESGTGLIITECIQYGSDGIEAHRRKCMDHETMDNPLEYYSASVTALARLAGAHKAGRLPPGMDQHFPWERSGSADPIPYTRDELEAELERCFAFARDYPRLLPKEVRTAEFMTQMKRDAFLVQDAEAAIQRRLIGDRRFIALCHWNAHIDNLFFWREGGALQCGLIDWGRVGQLTLGSALWGGLSAAHHDIWDHHLAHLLALFCREYEGAGGPTITPDELHDHLALHIATMGVARLLAAPEIIQYRLPQIGTANGPHDAMFLENDPARNYLHIYTVFLKHWRKAGIGDVIERLL